MLKHTGRKKCKQLSNRTGNLVKFRCKVVYDGYTRKFSSYCACSRNRSEKISFVYYTSQVTKIIQHNIKCLVYILIQMDAVRNVAMDVFYALGMRNGQ